MTPSPLPGIHLADDGSALARHLLETGDHAAHPIGRQHLGARAVSGGVR